MTSCRQNAVKPIVVSTDLRGEARVVGHRLARLGAALPEPARPICLIAGGETTVTLRGEGRGGRSQELALAAALALEGVEEVSLLAAGTDGSDGPTDAAGAFVDGWTIERGLQRGVRAQSCLGDNDSLRAHGRHRQYRLRDGRHQIFQKSSVLLFLFAAITAIAILLLVVPFATGF